VKLDGVKSTLEMRSATKLNRRSERALKNACRRTPRTTNTPRASIDKRRFRVTLIPVKADDDKNEARTPECKQTPNTSISAKERERASKKHVNK
jgi:NAD+--asparagine ADP-ribosyltransferase